LFLSISNSDPVITSGSYVDEFDFNGDGKLAGSDALRLFLDISDPNKSP